MSTCWAHRLPNPASELVHSCFTCKQKLNCACIIIHILPPRALRSQSWCHFHRCPSYEQFFSLSMLLGTPPPPDGASLWTQLFRDATSTWTHGTILAHKGSLSTLAQGKDLQLIRKNSFFKKAKSRETPRPDGDLRYTDGFLSRKTVQSIFAASYLLSPTAHI